MSEMADLMYEEAVQHLRGLADRIPPASPQEVRAAGAEVVSSMLLRGSIKHRGDVSWHKAPLPPRWHRCRGWSVNRSALGMVDFRRCACGGVWIDGGWIERNSRRKGKRMGRRAWGGHEWQRLAAVSLGAGMGSGVVSMGVWWLLGDDPWLVVVTAAVSIVITLVAILLFPFSWIATGRRGRSGSGES